jgi:hypothetical protein
MKKLLPVIFLLSIYFGIDAQTTLPYILDFESSTFPAVNCELSPAGSPQWVLETGYSGYGTGNGCMTFDNYNTATGSYDLRLPSMNFSHVALPYIRFDVAYAMQPSSVNSDVFGIWWSNNGTTNWQNLQGYLGNSLITAAPVANLYIPQPADWRTTTFPLSFLAGRPFVRLELQDDSYNSNKIYIDNIQVFDSATSGINTVLYSDLVNVFPNPFNDVVSIINQNQSKDNSVEIFNILGKKIYEGNLSEENNRIELTTEPGDFFIYKIIKENVIIKTGKLLKD